MVQAARFYADNNTTRPSLALADALAIELMHKET